MRQLPHVLTLARLAASPLIAWLILHARFREALGVTVFAGLTDWFDGFAARRIGVTGALGTVLDPLADKILLITLFVVLTAAGLVSTLVLSLVLGRDLVIVGGALLIRLFRSVRRFLPSTLGKVSTFFQIMFVLMVLLYAGFPYRVFFWLETTAIILMVVFTIWSGIDYVRRGIELARLPVDGQGSGE